MRWLLLPLAVLLFVPLAWAAGDNPWPAFKAPAKGEPAAIGGYSKGCLRGATELPQHGDGYQVMRPGRRRYFGHPALVDFVTQLSGSARREASTVLMVGDLSQVRGGRSNGGHSSHQTGLDVDIWYWHPAGAAEGPLARRKRQRLRARSVVQAKEGRIAPEWKDKVHDVLRLASLDPRVARIFVHPVIKRELCEGRAPKADTARDTAWLRKLRPWHGHDDHFHVRLHCPEGSEQCEPQAEVAAGDGCDALSFWFDEKAQAERRRARRSYQKNVDEGQGWPTACNALLK